jgi:hypothetical protein
VVGIEALAALGYVQGPDIRSADRDAVLLAGGQQPLHRRVGPQIVGADADGVVGEGSTPGDEQPLQLGEP